MSLSVLRIDASDFSMTGFGVGLVRLYRGESGSSTKCVPHIHSFMYQSVPRATLLGKTAMGVAVPPSEHMTINYKKASLVKGMAH